MGLDMYLYARRYVSDYSSGDKELRSELNKLSHLTDGFPIQEVKCEIMYWRKANAIHDWFVKNVQDGEDNCKPHYVPWYKLQELVELCKNVLANKKRAEEFLPTTNGFFFGTVEYDEWYFDGLRVTLDTLEKLLDNKEFTECYQLEYQSSW